MSEVQEQALVSHRTDHDVATELTLAYIHNSGTTDVQFIIKTWNEFFKTSVDAYSNNK